jgi:hypothetical protein
MRENFQRLEDGDLINIEVDLNAFAYSNRYSWLFSVFIKFNSLDENSNAFEEFLETKESLIIALEHDEKAKFVGMRVVDGWSEFYFYAQDSKSLDSTVAKILKPSDYIYESNVVKDSKWEFYNRNLFPTELELCHIESDKIIFLLEEEGDDLFKSRMVEHYVSFETPTQRDRFLKNLNIEGFSFKDDISSDEFDNGIALIKEHSVTRDEAKKVIENLFTEIKKENGYYEGWSTTLVKEENI